MTNAIERLKELVAAGGEADPTRMPASVVNIVYDNVPWRDITDQASEAHCDFLYEQECAAVHKVLTNARPDIAKLLEVVEAASKGVHKLDPLRAVIEIAERDGNLKALNPEVLARRLISEFEYQDAIRAALRNLETKETPDA